MASGTGDKERMFPEEPFCDNTCEFVLLCDSLFRVPFCRGFIQAKYSLQIFILIKQFKIFENTNNLKQFRNP